MNETPINPLKTALREGKAVVGSMVQDVRSPFVIQVMAGAGLDYALIDMEHGTIGIESAADLIQTARLAGIVPIVRVPDQLYHVMCPLLDAGAMGLMIPRLESAGQLEEVVSMTKYPPWGKRGAVGIKGQTNYRPAKLAEFLPKANEETMIIAQIELREAVDQLDEMLSVKGLDVALVGPADLSIALGIPGELSHPKEVETIDAVIAACKRKKIAAGVALGDIESMKRWKQKGMQFLCLGSETSGMFNWFLNVASELKD
jgi:2-dehydro-3-deoxyglucarate aldolase/4-hydroxy-2-oxoheptanedioate aldolase